MKAIVYTEYGSPEVLRLQEVEKPTPSADEVLVKVHAVSLTKGDRYLMRGTPFLLRMESGLRRPKKQILGMDIAGTVEAVGANITQFKVGDAVYLDNTKNLGGLAEYVCASPQTMALKPASISFEEVSTVPSAAITALQGLRDYGALCAGQSVLIVGASGGVGTYAVQIAKSLGATVTAVCSTRHLDKARALGADAVIDYTQEDFARSGKRYDLVLAVNGFRSLGDYRRVLKPGGIYVSAGGTMRQIFAAILLGPVVSLLGRKKMRSMGTVKPNAADLVYMNNLLEQGKVKAVVDRCYPLSETAEAMRFFESGRVQGRVVIHIA
ncbi:MAG: NAD(P)-dependent alcohol dehydrogenase [Anaerolinea sp.]|nr:NAD(P)-dependent alcohol dehydrogenase [Anaerolinea sp.]MCC6972875.1 NAD(P)-dependent alcohol dehydrogenase [Anaerolineae bacterium]